MVGPAAEIDDETTDDEAEDQCDFQRTEEELRLDGRFRLLGRSVSRGAAVTEADFRGYGYDKRTSPYNRTPQKFKATMKTRKAVIHTAGLTHQFQYCTMVAAALISAGTDIVMVYPSLGVSPDRMALRRWSRVLTEVPSRRRAQGRFHELGRVSDETARVWHEGGDLARGVGDAGGQYAHDDVGEESARGSSRGDDVPGAEKQTCALFSFQSHTVSQPPRDLFGSDVLMVVGTRTIRPAMAIMLICRDFRSRLMCSVSPALAPSSLVLPSSVPGAALKLAACLLSVSMSRRVGNTHKEGEREREREREREK